MTLPKPPPVRRPKYNPPVLSRSSAIVSKWTLQKPLSINFTIFLPADDSDFYVTNLVKSICRATDNVPPSQMSPVHKASHCLHNMDNGLANPVTYGHAQNMQKIYVFAQFCFCATDHQSVVRRAAPKSLTWRRKPRSIPGSGLECNSTLRPQRPSWRD